MHIDISACSEAPCWVYSNENVSGQFFYVFVEVYFVLLVRFSYFSASRE